MCTRDLLVIPYSGKLSRQKTGEKYNLCIENFRGLLAFAVPKDTMPPNFVEIAIKP